MTSSTSSPGTPPKRSDVQPGKRTGIKVIIVGAGLGGLACAIECRLKGHEVVCIDSVKKFQRLGDSIGVFPNAGKLVYRWGIHEELDALCGHSAGFTLCRYDGKVIERYFPKGPFDPTSPLYDAHRAEMHLLFFDRAKELGVQVIQGVKVTKYFEDDTGAQVWIGEGDDKILRADVAIGADGLKSHARAAVLGFWDAPKSSGYALFRAFFDSKLLLQNENLRDFCPQDGKTDARTAWIGPDVHFIVSTLKGGKEVNWVMTHKDNADIEESWQAPGSISDAIEVIKDWDPRIGQIIECTPEDSLIDWKLVHRDPLPTWVSPKGRIALLGDACHPFLPTGQNGASMAIEDGACIAVVLEKAGKYKLSGALRVYEKIRYERVLMAQARGEDVRNRWHKVQDWENVTGEQVSLAHPAWLFDHDASKHAEQEYEKVAQDIELSGYDQPNPNPGASSRSALATVGSERIRSQNGTTQGTVGNANGLNGVGFHDSATTTSSTRVQVNNQASQAGSSLI